VQGRRPSAGVDGMAGGACSYFDTEDDDAAQGVVFACAACVAAGEAGWDCTDWVPSVGTADIGRVAVPAASVAGVEVPRYASGQEAVGVVLEQAVEAAVLVVLVVVFGRLL